MIVGSLLLILVAVGLLVAGVLSGSNILIIVSIVATVVAAVILIVGVRQSASDEAEDEDGTPPKGGRQPDARERDRRAQRSRSHGNAGAVDPDSAAGGHTGSIPTQARQRHDGDIPAAPAAGGEKASSPAEPAKGDSGVAADDDPPGEPAVQNTSPEDAARIALLTNEVLVVDGRPRYHVDGCVHLLGRESEPLPAGEALELGFTPCGMCEPDSALLADAHRA